MKFRTILSTILGRGASATTRAASIPGATLALAAALTLICACGKHGEEEWSAPSDLTGWVVYSSTDGCPVSFYSSNLVNGLIEYHYDQKSNIGYVHVDGVPEDMTEAFTRMDQNLKTIDLSHLDFSNCTSMRSMFYGCSAQKINLSGIKAPKVTDMSRMFQECRNLTEVNMDGFDASGVEEMMSMFQDCSSIETVDLSRVTGGSKCRVLLYMFQDCGKLRSFDLGTLGKGPIEKAGNMLMNCRSLQSIDLTGFNWPKLSYSDSYKVVRILSGTAPSSIRIPAALTAPGGEDAFLGVESDGTLYYPKGTDPSAILAELRRDGHKWEAVEY